MNFRYATLVAVPLLGAVSYLTFLQLQPSDTTTHDGSAVSVDHSSNTMPLERETGTNMDDLAALKRELTSLRTEVLAQRNQMLKQAAPVPSRLDFPPAHDTRSDPIARAEAASARLAQIGKVDPAFRQQATDQSWSANTTSAIRDALNSEDVGGVQAESIDCRSSSCRVEFHDDGTGQLSKSLPIFALQLAGSMPNITASTVPQGNGASNVVLYMSRESGEQPSR